MIPEFGHYALILAMLMAVVQALGLTAPLRPLVRRAAFLQFTLCALAFGALTWSYIVTDLSVANVAQNSHTLKPLIYKISGVWGNHEGSMLLWIFFLSLFGALIALSPSSPPPAGGRIKVGGMKKAPSPTAASPSSLTQRQEASLPSPPRGEVTIRALAIQGLLSVGFYAFLLFTSNPFLRVKNIPFDGNGLNPLLQDPGLAFHPPMLFAGYVGFSAVFSFAAAALIDGKVDQSWAKIVRPWILLAWTLLGAGIALGSWWAYYEMGWGGWWYWDPVENASLLPWLMGTALLHSVIVLEKRNSLKRWTILMAVLAFSLSLLGTFLVRSGVLTSVHAFAVDPARGIFILALLITYTGGALALYAWRAPSLKGGRLFAPVSRESAILLNNLFLATGTATVLIGTLYPLILSAFDAGMISVGPPYFEATFVPLMIPMILLMVVGPFLPWKKGEAAAVAKRLSAALIVAVFVGMFLLGFKVENALPAALGMGLAAWLMTGVLTALSERIKLFRGPFTTSWERLKGLKLSYWGMVVAHAGVAVALAGMIGTNLWASEDTILMSPGDKREIGRYELTFAGVEDGYGPNYVTAKATVQATIKATGEPYALLHPERRAYPVSGKNTTEAAIQESWHDDLYVALGDSDPDSPGDWVIRSYVHPLVPYLWGGFALIVLGGVLSFLGLGIKREEKEEI